MNDLKTIRIISLEREYGCGGPTIAEMLAKRMGWTLWDRQLTAKIAEIAHVTPSAVQRCDERRDSVLYRLSKVFMRGSYERTMTTDADSDVFDTDRMVTLAEKVILDLAKAGRCVIVGRGAPYILRGRSDTFHVFLYAPREEKLRRLIESGMSEKEANEDLDTVDRERAAFIKQYYGKQWPTRTLYDAMLNTSAGNETVVETILALMGAHDRSGARTPTAVE